MKYIGILCYDKQYFDYKEERSNFTNIFGAYLKYSIPLHVSSLSSSSNFVFPITSRIYEILFFIQKNHYFFYKIFFNCKFMISPCSSFSIFNNSSIFSTTFNDAIIDSFFACNLSIATDEENKVIYVFQVIFKVGFD